MRPINPFVPTSKVLVRLPKNVPLIQKDGQPRLPFSSIRDMAKLIKAHGVAGVYIDPRQHPDIRDASQYDDLFLNSALKLKRSLNRHFNFNTKRTSRFGVSLPGGNNIAHGVTAFHNDGGKMAGIMYYPKQGLKYHNNQWTHPYPKILGGHAQVAPHYDKKPAITFPTAQDKILLLYMYGGKGGLSHRATPTLLPYRNPQTGKTLYLEHRFASSNQDNLLPNVHRGVNNLFFERGISVAAWENP
jgi:hypothetical protein